MTDAPLTRAQRTQLTVDAISRIDASFDRFQTEIVDILELLPQGNLYFAKAHLDANLQFSSWDNLILVRAALRRVQTMAGLCGAPTDFDQFVRISMPTFSDVKVYDLYRDEIYLGRIRVPPANSGVGEKSFFQTKDEIEQERASA